MRQRGVNGNRHAHRDRDGDGPVEEWHAQSFRQCRADEPSAGSERRADGDDRCHHSSLHDLIGSYGPSGGCVRLELPSHACCSSEVIEKVLVTSTFRRGSTQTLSTHDPLGGIAGRRVTMMHWLLPRLLPELLPPRRSVLVLLQFGRPAQRITARRLPGRSPRRPRTGVWWQSSSDGAVSVMGQEAARVRADPERLGDAGARAFRRREVSGRIRN